MIASRFYVNIIPYRAEWPNILSAIPSSNYNTALILNRKMRNKLAYEFILICHVDLIYWAFALNFIVLISLQLSKEAKNSEDFAYLSYIENYNKVFWMILQIVNNLILLRWYKDDKILMIEKIITNLT